MFRLFLALALAISAAFCNVNASASASSASISQNYGKHLLAEFDIDAETIHKFRNHQASEKDPHESALVNSLLADTADWKGTGVQVDSQKNPHTIVVTLSAIAAIDGDAVSMWHAGWENRDGFTTSQPLPGLMKSSVKAGERFSVTAASPPISFKRDAELLPVLGLVSHSNMHIKSIHVQIWSGIANASPMDVFFAMRWALVGLVMLALWWLFKRSA